MIIFYASLIVVFLIGFLLDLEALIPIGWWLVALSIVIYFRCKKKEDKYTSNWLNPSYLLLFGILIVALQTILNVTVGLAPFSVYISESYEKYLTKATYIGFISVVTYLLGNCIKIRPIQIKAKWRMNYALSPWLVLMVVFFSLFIIHIDIASFISGSTYAGSGAYNRVIESSGYYEQLLEVSFVIIVSIVTYTNLGKTNKLKIREFLISFPIVFWIVLILYMLLRMLSGDRGPVLYSMCLILYSFLMCTKHRFSLITVVSLIVGAAFFTTLLGVVRNGNLNQSFWERVENASLVDNVKKPSVLSSTQELANSVNTEFIALSASEAPDFNHTYGKYTFYAIIGSIPGSSYVLTNFFGVNLRETMSSEFITVSHFGNNYRFGLGTSPMAENYLEFGILGIVLGFIFLGWCFNHLDYVVFRSDARTPLWLIIIALKLSSVAIYIPRSSVAGCISKALYTLIIFLVLNFVFQLFQRKRYHKLANAK